MLLIDFLLQDDFPWINGVNAILNDIEQPGRDELIRNRPTYNEHYFEVTVQHYNLDEFKSHFRMSRLAMQSLCEIIAPLLHERHLFISLEKKMCFFVWLLAKQESFLAVSDRFGFNKGTGYYIFKTILNALTLLKEEWIKWPTHIECNNIALRIEDKCRIPGVVGALDGTHIPIKQPKNNAVDFFNRYQQHSIILQAVCNDNRIFTDVCVGMPGRLHDARVFRNSLLYEKLNNNPPLLPAHQHLLADSAYPLMQCVLKPYRDNGHLTPRQQRCNTVMNGQRAVIEQAFGLLKGKWRRLKYLDMSLPEAIPEVVLAACILHNFVLLTDSLEYEVDDAELQNEDDNQDNVDNQGDPQGAIAKRDYIATLL